MKIINTILMLLCLSLMISCKKEVKENRESKPVQIEKENDTFLNQLETVSTNKDSSETVKKDTFLKDVVTVESKTNNPETTIKDTSFINIKTLSNDFILDFKYATTDNFLHQKVYDCADCYLRKNTALALIKANNELITKGFRIKLYDCYRPLDIQKKMWKILPGTHYVANPKKGSKHNRGAAVDLTLVDSQGNELDMGTKFDFFGKEAHHTYTKHSKEVLQNRKLLKETLAKYNFKSIYNEWWHYEYRPEISSNVSNFKWECK